jgi:hypothetical protein
VRAAADTVAFAVTQPIAERLARGVALARSVAVAIAVALAIS